MSSTTVAEFANELKKSTDTLLDQLKSAGVAKASASDVLTDADKHSLLNFLQTAHGTSSPDRKKITLVKKQTTEIKQADATGKARTIQVEVRKKRTFVRRDDDVVAAPEAAPEEVQATAPAAPLIDDAELARREEEARRQAELIRRQEEELAQRRRDREEQEARAREAADKAAAELQAQKDSEATKKSKSKAAGEAAEAQVQAQAEEAARNAALALEKSAAAAAASKAAADEEVARAVDLGDRRRKAEAEAAAIRSMMSAPKRVLVAHKPEPVKAPVADPKAIKGTLHKPAAGSTAAKPAKPAATGGPAASAPGGSGKEVKSAKLSSSWAGDPAKKKAIPTRGDTGAGAGRATNWRAGPRGRRGARARRGRHVVGLPRHGRRRAGHHQQSGAN